MIGLKAMKILEQTSTRLVLQHHPTLSRIASIFVAIFGVSILAIPANSSDEIFLSIFMSIVALSYSILTILFDKTNTWTFDKESSAFTIEEKSILKKEIENQKIQNIREVKKISAPQHRDDLLDNRFSVKIKTKNGKSYNLCSDLSLSNLAAQEVLNKILIFLDLNN